MTGKEKFTQVELLIFIGMTRSPNNRSLVNESLGNYQATITIKIDKLAHRES